MLVWLKNRSVFSILLCLLIIAAAYIFIVAASKQPTHLLLKRLAVPVTQVTLETATDVTRQITLPASLSPLPPGSQVVVHASLTVGKAQSLLVKTVFSQLKVYINGVQSADIGQTGTYLEMMNDPPTLLSIIDLPQEGGTVELRMEYVSPTQRSTLSLPRLYVGDRLSIFARFFVAEGFSFLFSTLLLIIGVFMTLFSLPIVGRTSSGKAFFWLGLFALSSGAWGFGECDLTAFIIPYPTLLYHMTYLGLFFMTFSFLRFGLLVLEPHTRWPLLAMLYIHAFTILTAILLQITGKVDFIRSLYWFHIIVPVGFLLFAGVVLWEHFHHHNVAAHRFAPALLLLSIAVVIEVLNYWFRFISYFTLFFQLGVLAFVIALGVAISRLIQESFKANADHAILTMEMKQANQLLLLYKRQYESITHNDLEVRRQRHDLRHQLTVIRDLNRHAETEKLHRYIDGLIEAIPGNPELQLCENTAINAVASHYVLMARNAGIITDVLFQIPADTGVMQEIDLCIIIGNLLENAVEACIRASMETRKIKLHATMKNDHLRITCENSYPGVNMASNGKLMSSKHSGEGVGIRSVQAVVEKYGGITRFEAGDDLFLSLVFVRMNASQT